MIDNRWVVCRKNGLSFWYHPSPEQLYVTCGSCQKLGISTAEILIVNDEDVLIGFDGEPDLGLKFDKLYELRPKEKKLFDKIKEDLIEAARTELEKE